MRRTALILLALLACAPTVALADSDQVLEDCQDGRIDKKYSAKDLRDALEDMPADLDEYTSCREVIRSAQQGVRGGGGSGPGSNFNDAQGYGALPAGEGGLPLGPDSKPIDPRGIATEEERADLDRARKGEGLSDSTTGTAGGLAPQSAGVAPSKSDADLPTPLIVLLVLVALGSAAALVPRVRELVSRRSA
jgi:hypothetical protein